MEYTRKNKHQPKTQEAYDLRREKISESLKKYAKIRKEVAFEKQKQKIKKYESTPKVCKNCGKTYYKAWNKGGDSPFCSCKCSRGYSTKQKREEISKNVAKKLKGRITGNAYKRYGCKTIEELRERYLKNPKKCAICGAVIPYERRNRKSCSEEC